MGILVLLVIFSPIGIDIYIPSFTTIVDYYHTTPDRVQYTLSLFILCMGLGQLVVGPLVDKYGRRKIALYGILLYFLTSALGSVAQSIDQLIVMRALQGLSACCTTTVAFAVVRDLLSPRESAQAFSYLNAALNVSPALAPSIGGALATLFFWQASFIFMAIFALIVWGLVWFKLPETRPEKQSGERVSPFASYKTLLSHSVFMINSACCMAAMAIILTYVSFAPQILVGQLGHSESRFALLFGGNALGIMVSSILAGRFMHQLGERGCMIIGALLMIIGGLSMATSYWLSGTSTWGFMAPVMIASSGFAWLLGAATGKALAPFAHIAGTASALLVCIQMLGAALISMVAQAISLPLSITLAVMMGIAGVIPLLVIAAKKNNHGERALALAKAS
ncbi:multidrug effflux MFS transporter [Endozoicomonas sp. Mp262]|uniref:multidrug effflux MFS transporter n=1 Tax=Endozoicomonas sp. Mp262 TaxID=2919499 RepID=UPI0021DAAFEB